MVRHRNFSRDSEKFPYPNSFNMNGGKVTFSYHKALDSNPLIFLVDVEEHTESLPSRLLVKLSRQYPAGIHKECADLGIAPKLYGFDSLAGGCYGIYAKVLLTQLGNPRQTEV